MTSEGLIERSMQWLEADPLYAMTDAEFAQLAQRGTIPASSLSDRQTVDAVLAGEKPAGVIRDRLTDSHDVRSPIQRALRGGLLVREMATHNLNSRAYVVARTDECLAAVQTALQLLQPALDVAFGRALGYSEADVAQYLMHNFGGRPRGAALTSVMYGELRTRAFAQRSGYYFRTWGPYRPWTSSEVRTGRAEPPPSNAQYRMARPARQVF